MLITSIDQDSVMMSAQLSTMIAVPKNKAALQISKNL